MKEFLIATTAMFAVSLVAVPKDTTKTVVHHKKVAKKAPEKKTTGELNEENSFSIFNFTFKFQ